MIQEKFGSLSQPFPVSFLNPSSFYLHLPAYEDGTDRVFRNGGI